MNFKPILPHHLSSICLQLITFLFQVSVIALGGKLSIGAASHFFNEILDKCRERYVF